MTSLPVPCASKSAGPRSRLPPTAECDLPLVLSSLSLRFGHVSIVPTAVSIREVAARLSLERESRDHHSSLVHPVRTLSNVQRVADLAHGSHRGLLTQVACRWVREIAIVRKPFSGPIRTIDACVLEGHVTRTSSSERIVTSEISRDTRIISNLETSNPKSRFVKTRPSRDSCAAVSRGCRRPRSRPCAPPGRFRAVARSYPPTAVSFETDL